MLTTASSTPEAKTNWRDVATFVISLVVIVGFLVYSFWFSFMTPHPDPAQLGTIQGVLEGSFAGVVGYWVGSSISSSAKNDKLQARPDAGN